MAKGAGSPETKGSWSIIDVRSSDWFEPRSGLSLVLEPDRTRTGGEERLRTGPWRIGHITTSTRGSAFSSPLR